MEDLNCKVLYVTFCHTATWHLNWVISSHSTNALIIKFSHRGRGWPKEPPLLRACQPCCFILGIIHHHLQVHGHAVFDGARPFCRPELRCGSTVFVVTSENYWWIGGCFRKKQNACQCLCTCLAGRFMNGIHVMTEKEWLHFCKQNFNSKFSFLIIKFKTLTIDYE